MALYKGTIKLDGVESGFLPENSGDIGQVLKKTATGYNWANESGGGGGAYTAGEGINIDANNEISNTLPGPTISSTAPSSPIQGMEWYDTTNNKLKVYDGTNWNATGKEYHAGEGISIGTYYDYGAMRGPCEEGYHIPSPSEWNSVISIMNTLGISGFSNYETYLMIPRNGNINYNGMSFNRGSNFAYRTCSLTQEFGNSGQSMKIMQGYKAAGYSIRPFKDKKIIPNSSWTRLFNGDLVANGAGIFYNQFKGLISLSADGTTWITIADKNVGATTVFNYGDTANAANCGKYFQWGNNHGFDYGTQTVTSGTQVDASTYGPGNYYDSSTFIITSNTGTPWDSSENANLWGATTGVTTINDTISNTGVLSVNGESGDVIIEADLSNYLAKDNTTSFTPTGDYNPATKKYVDDRDTYIGSSAPTSNLVEGRLWYDTTNDVLKSYDGTNWIEVGVEGNTKTFYLSSTSDLVNAQAVIDYILSGKNAIVSYQGVNYIYAYYNSNNYNKFFGFDNSDLATSTSGLTVTKIHKRLIIRADASTNVVNNISTSDIVVSDIYSAGTGLTKTGTVLSADTTVLATKADLADLGSFEVVASLPSVDTADEKTIYLLGPIGTGADKYEEWIVTNDIETKTFTRDGYNYNPGGMELSVDTTFTYDSSVGTGDISISDGMGYIAKFTSTGRYLYDSNISDYVFVDATTIDIPAGIYPNIGAGTAAYDSIIFDTSSKQWTKIGETSIDLSNYLAKDNTTSFTPSGDYNPATKKYVDDGDTIIAATAPAGTEGQLWYDTTNDVLKTYDGTQWNATSDFPGMTILKYGISTWNDFITAYNENAIVYCRASSNTNPATGSQTRLAFMAYVNNETAPTEVEFQYYRSRSDHNSAANQLDQVFVYKLTSASGGTWTVTERNTAAKAVAGTGINLAFGSGNMTITNSLPFNPGSGTTGQVLTKTADGYEWATAMSYSDYNWASKSGATVTLSLNSTITPSADFTVDAPATIHDGQTYILRVNNGATAYTMTLGTNITNPYGEDLTLTANGLDQFVFLAVGGVLELQPSVGGGDYKLAPNSPLSPKYRRYGTQAQYEALTQYYTDVPGDTVYFTI